MSKYKNVNIVERSYVYKCFITWWRNYIHVVHEDHLFKIRFCTCVPKVQKLLFLCRWFYFESFKVKWYINEHKALWLVFRTNSGTYRRHWKGKFFTPTSRSINTNFTKTVGKGGWSVASNLKLLIDRCIPNVSY